MDISNIILSGLYRCTQPKKYYPGDNYTHLYHARNWTFKPYIKDDGSVSMLDTFYNNEGIDITEDNICDFEFIFDFNEVELCSWDELKEYDEKDVYIVPTDSGGLSYGKRYWRNKNAKRSKEKLLQIYKEKCDFLECQLENVISDIELIKSGKHWKLKNKDLI